MSKEGAPEVREQAAQRLTELRAEQQQGQQLLADLDARQAALRETLLRISGAIQVLAELLGDSAQAPAATVAAGTSTAAGNGAAAGTGAAALAQPR